MAVGDNERRFSAYLNPCTALLVSSIFMTSVAQLRFPGGDRITDAAQELQNGASGGSL
jgi:hypothetical protein